MTAQKIKLINLSKYANVVQWGVILESCIFLLELSASERKPDCKYRAE